MLLVKQLVVTGTAFACLRLKGRFSAYRRFAARPDLRLTHRVKLFEAEAELIDAWDSQVIEVRVDNLGFVASVIGG